MDNVNRDYYDVIGVPRNADPKQIKEAYNWLAEKYRPERNPDNLQAAKNFALIEEAYETLGNPARRAAYDINLWSPRDVVGSSAAAKVDASGSHAPPAGTRHRAETSAANLSGKRGYVQQVLGKDEHVQYAARVSLACFWPVYVVGVLSLTVAVGMIFLAINEDRGPMGFGLFTMAFGLAMYGWPTLVRSTTELALTNRRIIAKFGVISRNTVEISFKKIESIRVKQGIIGRMLDYGDLIVTGSGATHAPIPNIDNPLEFRRAFDAAMERFDQTEKAKSPS